MTVMYEVTVMRWCAGGGYETLVGSSQFSVPQEGLTEEARQLHADRVMDTILSDHTRCTGEDEHVRDRSARG